MSKLVDCSILPIDDLDFVVNVAVPDSDVFPSLGTFLVVSSVVGMPLELSLGGTSLPELSSPACVPIEVSRLLVSEAGALEFSVSPNRGFEPSELGLEVETSALEFKPG